MWGGAERGAAWMQPAAESITPSCPCNQLLISGWDFGFRPFFWAGLSLTLRKSNGQPLLVVGDALLNRGEV